MLSRCQPRYIGTVLAAAIVLLLLPRLVAAVSAAPSLAVGALVVIPEIMLLAPLVGGVLLIGFGWTQRAGSALHCKACGYADRPGRIAPVCPECGAAWRWYGGQVRGTPMRHPECIWLGLPLLVGALLIQAWQLVAPSGFLLTVPTQVLMGRAMTAPGPELRAVLDELESRALTPEARRSLIEGLLDRRIRQDGLPLIGEQWMLTHATGGTIDSALADRVFEEMLELRLSDPSAGYAEGLVEVSLKGVYRGPRSDRVGWVMVEGVSLTDAAGGNAPISTVPMPPRPHRAGDLDGHRPIGVRLEGAAPPGPAELRVSCWVLVSDERLLVQGVTRFADGSCYIPQGVPWARRVELVAHVPAAMLSFEHARSTPEPAPALRVSTATDRARTAELVSRLVGADEPAETRRVPSRTPMGHRVGPLASIARQAPKAAYEVGYGVGTRPQRWSGPWSLGTSSGPITAARSIAAPIAQPIGTRRVVADGPNTSRPNDRFDDRVDLRAKPRRP